MRNIGKETRSIFNGWIILLAIWPSISFANPYFDYDTIATSVTPPLEDIRNDVGIDSFGEVVFVGHEDIDNRLGQYGLYLGTGNGEFNAITPSLTTNGVFLTSLDLADSALGVTVVNGRQLIQFFSLLADGYSTIHIEPDENRGILNPRINNNEDVAFMTLRFPFLQSEPPRLATISSTALHSEIDMNFLSGMTLADTGQVFIRWFSSRQAGIDSDFTDGDIRQYRRDLSTHEIVARAGTSGATFTYLGRRIAVSEDGAALVFTGTLSDTGANAINALQTSNHPYSTGVKPRLLPLNEGKGVFIALKTPDKGRWVIQRVVGLSGNGILDPGETCVQNDNDPRCIDSEGDFGTIGDISFFGNVDIVSTYGSRRGFGVVFEGIRAGHLRESPNSNSVFFTRIGVTNQQLSDEFDIHSPVAASFEQSRSITYDGMVVGADCPTVNECIIPDSDAAGDLDLGQILVLCQCSNDIETLIRATPRQLVYLDYDAPTRGLSTIGTEKLKKFLPPRVSLPGEAWEGSMAHAFSILAPTRSIPILQIQTQVKQKVQSSFDNLDSVRVASARVNVLSSHVDGPPPDDGEFHAVWIGDGPIPTDFDNRDGNRLILDFPGGLDFAWAPLSPFNNRILSGNRGRDVVGRLSREQRAEIFVDHIFGFGNLHENGRNPDPVSLDSTSGSSAISDEQISTILSNFISHETGHLIGLEHVRRDKDNETLMIDAFFRSQERGVRSDSVRSRIYFSNSGLSNRLVGVKDEVVGSARVAFATGSESPIINLNRQPPSTNILKKKKKKKVEIVVSGPSRTLGTVLQKLLVVVFRSGDGDFAPSIYDYDMVSTTNSVLEDIELNEGDSILLIGSTTGVNVDVLGLPMGGTPIDFAEPLSNIHEYLVHHKYHADVIGPDFYWNSDLAQLHIFDGLTWNVAAELRITSDELPDSDADGVPNGSDNCVLEENDNQQDTDFDGIGNQCDADLNNDGFIDFLDLALFRLAYLSDPDDVQWNPSADFDGNGIIDDADLDFLRDSMFGVPGPSTDIPVPISGIFEDVGVYLDVGTAPSGSVVVDVNADGMVDIITSNAGSNNVSVRLGMTGETFALPVFFAAGESPGKPIAHDIDGDGFLDLALLNEESSELSLLYGVGERIFASRTRLLLDSPASDFKLIDTNNDSLLDIVYVEAKTGDVIVLRGTGSREFALSSRGTTGSGRGILQAADLNRDGMPDVVTAHQSTNQVTVLINNGMGAFETPTFIDVDGGPIALILADLNNDSHGDIGLIRFGGRLGLGVLPGNGDGTFGDMLNVGQGYLYPLDSMVATDLNNDALIDVVVCSITRRQVTAILQLPDGGHEISPTVYSSETGSCDQGVDIDADGQTDIFVTDSTLNAVVALYGRGDGTFRAPTEIEIGPELRRVTMTDVNQDSINDLIINNTYTISVRLGAGNGDYVLEATYVEDGQIGWLLVQDFDGDGNPDLCYADRENDEFRIRLGEGDGTFNAARPATGVPSVGVLMAGDVDGDNVLDIVAGQDIFGIQTTFVAIGNGDGTFQEVVPYLLNDSSVQRFNAKTLVDINNDDRLDIVGTYRNHGSGGPDGVAAFVNDGTGVFSEFDLLFELDGAGSVRAAHLNDDNQLDLVVTTQWRGGLSIRMHCGSNEYCETDRHELEVVGSNSAIGDLDGDNLPDIAVGAGGSVFVFSNRGNGTFRHRNLYRGNFWPFSFQMVDSNSDGLLDILTVDPLSTISILVNQGAESN